MIVALRTCFVLLLLLRLDGVAFCQATLHITDATADQGTFAHVEVLLDNSDPVVAWSFGVTHDPWELFLVDVAPGSAALTANAGAPPDFMVVNTDPNPGPGWTVGAIVDLAGTNSMAPGPDQQLFVATYVAIGNPGDDAQVSFTDVLGTPPVGVCLPTTVNPGCSGIVNQIPGTVSIPITGFVRGDCNLDGNVNLGDVRTLLLWQFSGTSIQLACEDACDFNDDGELNLSDTISSLIYQFQMGPDPPPPFPGCGSDPTSDTLSCIGSGACP